MQLPRKLLWRGMWDLNPRGLSTTDLAGLPHTRLGESRMKILFCAKPVSANQICSCSIKPFWKIKSNGATQRFFYRRVFCRLLKVYKALHEKSGGTSPKSENRVHYRHSRRHSVCALRHRINRIRVQNSIQQWTICRINPWVSLLFRRVL